METFPDFEQREREIDKLIEELAVKEEMSTEEIIGDIISFSVDDRNNTPNPEYLELVAEKLDISIEEMITYSIKKYSDSL